MQSKVFSTNKTLNLRGTLMDLSVPRVMGILNITPDSFYDGGRYTEANACLHHVENMLQQGADMIDVGGYSTRPGATQISESDEMDRVIPVVRQLARQFPGAVLSIDTFRAAVARAAIGEGASLINDISGGELDRNMFDSVAALQVPYILMHMRGTPQTMKQLVHYDDLLKELVDYFNVKVKQLRTMGIKDVIVDPGFGFAKTAEQNFKLLRQLRYLEILGAPILTGLSRKSMIWKTLETNAEGALHGTTSLHTIALLNGASILRVHDVKEAVQTVKLFQTLIQSPASTPQNFEY